LGVVEVQSVAVRSDVKVQALLVVSIRGCEAYSRLRTKALPTSDFHLSSFPSKVATAHPGHSSATDRELGLMARDSKAWSSPRSSTFVMVEGMSTALAASAKWAKTPNLLGDIVGCVQEIAKVERRRGVAEQKYQEDEGGGASAVHYDCRRVICHVKRRTLRFSCQHVARVKHSPNQAKQPVNLATRQSILQASEC